MIRLALPTGNYRANKYGVYPEVVRVITNENMRELGESMNMFSSNQPAPQASWLKGLAQDASAQIAYEVEDLIDEVIVHQPKCNACTVSEKCVEHFRGNRQGCIATEFDSLFLGQFESNCNN